MRTPNPAHALMSIRLLLPSCSAHEQPDWGFGTSSTFKDPDFELVRAIDNYPRMQRVPPGPFYNNGDYLVAWGQQEGAAGLSGRKFGKPQTQTPPICRHLAVNNRRRPRSA